MRLTDRRHSTRDPEANQISPATSVGATAASEMCPVARSVSTTRVHAAVVTTTATAGRVGRSRRPTTQCSALELSTPHSTAWPQTMSRRARGSRAEDAVGAVAATGISPKDVISSRTKRWNDPLV